MLTKITGQSLLAWRSRASINTARKIVDLPFYVAHYRIKQLLLVLILT